MKNKTKFVIVSWKPYNVNEYVKLGMYYFEIINDCLYLGTILTNKNKLRSEIAKIITNTNGAYYALHPLLKSQSALRAEKKELYTTLIEPLATYGAEPGTVNKDTAKQLAAFE
jgi:hypothetical protein